MTDKPNPLATFTPAQLIKAYDALETQTSALDDELKKKKAPLTQRMNAITNELLRRMAEEEATSYPTEYGRMTRKTHQDYSVQDITAFSDFVINSKDLSFFGKSLSKPAVQAYIKQNEKLPPGVAAFTKYSIAFTRK